jgi:PAS domain S-box-containing protein
VGSRCISLIIRLLQERILLCYGPVHCETSQDGSETPTEMAALRAALQAAEATARDARESLAALTQSESYFRHLTEYALDLITILDADGTIRFESKSIETELGYGPEEYIGRNAFDFVHPEDAPRVIQAFVNALQSHGSTPVLSFRFRHRDGSYRLLEGRGNNLLEDPAVRGIVFNSRDLTEQRRLEEQFLQSQKVQAIGQLTGGVAHDFNNILTAIIGYSELTLPALEEDSVTHGYVHEIRKAAERAASLTRQLLAFSRKQALKPRVLDLEAIIADMEKMLRRVLGEEIDLVSIAEPHTEDRNVKADLTQIEQVLLNLAVNARDAMGGRGSLTIETSKVTLNDREARLSGDLPPGDYLLLSVGDTGCGMSKTVQEHIFEPFFTTKEEGKGTGLGLATCEGIIRQSGGHITVESTIGKGTTFKIHLPIVNESVEKPVVEAVDDGLVPEGNETVLLVEDEPMLLELGQTVLSDLGYQVLVAENGSAALRLVLEDPSRRIDLLLTDVIMPEMGGRELVEHLRIISPETKVIFCSGYTEDAIFTGGGIEAGVFFLQKPYTVEGVAHKVRAVLAAA